MHKLFNNISKYIFISKKRVYIFLFVLFSSFLIYLYIDHYRYNKYIAYITSDIIKNGENHTPVKNIFPGIEWDTVCQLAQYSTTSGRLRLLLKEDFSDYKIFPTKVYILEGELGIAVINYSRKEIHVIILDNKLIHRINFDDTEKIQCIHGYNAVYYIKDMISVSGNAYKNMHILKK